MGLQHRGSPLANQRGQFSVQTPPRALIATNQKVFIQIINLQEGRELAEFYSIAAGIKHLIPDWKDSESIKRLCEILQSAVIIKLGEDTLTVTSN